MLWKTDTKPASAVHDRRLEMPTVKTHFMFSFTDARDNSWWDWTLMTMVPDWLGAEHMERAQETLTRKRGRAVVKEVRLESVMKASACRRCI
ncbi:hypothetical protein [Paenarthrobacter sp. UW852]|uniref:hypothetical protein n=1 Tax=Paenarthrobacter sp. UW852 TaxID=2951989 RepID=UPI0027D30ECC|nr:hypothetical protein [Paenarthrobacter sp. UW852]